MKALDIIKAMPLDEKEKIRIVSIYDDLDSRQKLTIDHIAWSTYYALYDERLEENLGLQYQAVKKGDDHFGGDFYARALAKTDKDMKGEFEESLVNANLSIARTAMGDIMREIHAAKKDSRQKS